MVSTALVLRIQVSRPSPHLPWMPWRWRHYSPSKWQGNTNWMTYCRFLISNFRCVLNVVCFLLGNSLASEFYMLTFRNTLFHLHGRVGTKKLIFISTRLWRWNRQSVLKHWHIKFRCQGITQKKAYNTLSLPKRLEFSVIIIVCFSHVVLTCYVEGINKKNLFQQSVPLHQAPFLILYFYWPS